MEREIIEYEEYIEKYLNKWKESGETLGDMLRRVFNDFESRTCENCKFDCNSVTCNKGVGRPYEQINDSYGVKVNKDFSCNKWDSK